MFFKFFLFLLFLSNHSPLPQTPNEPGVVHAVLFYSPTCGHCQLVIRESILPLAERYGDRFQIVGIDTTQPQGQALYDAARNYSNLEFRGVPFLVIGDEYLSGSVEIPQKLPAMIDKYMAQGGVDWPVIPGLQEAIYASLTAQPPTPTPPAGSFPTPTPGPVLRESGDPPDAPSFTQVETRTTLRQRIMFDPVGNGLAILIPLGMVDVLIHAAFSSKSFRSVLPFASNQGLIPILCFLGWESPGIWHTSK